MEESIQTKASTDEETSWTEGNTKGPIKTLVVNQIQSPAAGDFGAIPLLSFLSRLQSQLFADASSEVLQHGMINSHVMYVNVW